MNKNYWQQQTAAAPLFPDLLWSRPETQSLAGKLLIIGGNGQGFAAAAEGYGYAMQAGIGVSRVVLPDALQKSVSSLFPEASFAPSTPSGSFATQALGELLPMADWADGVLVAGDLSRNSETAILLESFLSKYPGAVTLTKDAIEYVCSQPQLVSQRSNTLLTLSFSQLQRLVIALRSPLAITSGMDLLRTVEALHQLTTDYEPMIMTKHLDKLFVAINGQVSTTPCPGDERIWRLKTAARASVWWLQNPSQPFAALSTSLIAD